MNLAKLLQFFLTTTLTLLLIASPFLSLAQTATDGLNVNLTVTGGGGGGGGGGDPIPVYGCTDPAAINYNSAANTDDGSCQYVGGVPNVTNFQAVPNVTVINLSWQNPNFANLQAVRIVRLQNQVPLDPGDGVLIYEGTGESFTDSDVVPDVNYIYAAFVRSTNGQYSSGAIAQAIITLEEEEECAEPPCEELPPGDEPPPDPFSQYPDASSSLPSASGLTFIQPGQLPQIYGQSGTVQIDGNKNLSVFLPAGAVPPTLKTIGLTLFAPGEPQRSFTFLLRLNKDRTGYEATLAPLQAGGRYNFVLHVINYRDQRVQKLEGFINVSGVGSLPVGTVTKTLSNLSVGVGVAVGLVQFLAITTQAKSLFDVYLILLRAMAALLGYFGVRRRQQPWGTVYDAVTKQPIDPALVTVYKDGKEIMSAITDIDGRYGFYLPTGTYTIKAEKTHYTFPSVKLIGRTGDELYANLYFGEPITITTEGEIINKNIPLDPIGFDWNEFAKNKGNFLKLASRRERWWNGTMNAIYIIGALVALTHALLSPSAFDFVVLGLYVVIFLAQRFWVARYPAVSLKRGGEEPLPYSVVRVFLPGLDQEIKKVITDELGRFYLLVRPGEYYLKVEEKLPDATYQEIYRSTPMTLKTGVLKKDLIVP